MQSIDIPVGLAFLAGLASFLSPCVLSLVPVYVGYLSGRAAGGESAAHNRWITLSHGLAFVIGFSVVFIFFNIIAATLGGLLYSARSWLAKIGGVIVVIFGLHMIGVFRIPFLEYDVRVHSETAPRWGYISSFLLGIFFSAGWSPCVGPILGAIMTFAANGGSIIRGTMLGAFYSSGLAIPFLLAALGIGWVTTLVRKYGKIMRVAEISMGAIMVIAGILLFAGSFSLMANLFPIINFGL